MRGIIRLLTCCFIFIFGYFANAWSAPTCSSSYSSCLSGYYLSSSGQCVLCTDGCTCAGGTAQPQCSVTCSAGYYKNSSNTCSQCETGYYCPGGTYARSSSVAGRNSCPTAYPSSDAGVSAVTSCYTLVAPSCTQNNGNTPTNCYSVTEWNSCSCDTTKYRQYSNSDGNGNGTTGGTTSYSCIKTPKTVTAKSGYRVDGTSCSTCPTAYPNSADGNSGGYTACYSNTKSRAWSGSQTPCSAPNGCSSATCNTCSIAACDYVAYSNANGNGDGSIKTGCETNNASCQQT
ncbi:MAG: hypothetical protein KBS86_02845, partial [Proteobacteria bacterium]|nr:hypothetical protein [Candidatus Enterousia scatequi]